LILTFIGILVASMGMDTLTGSPGSISESLYLLGGIPFTPFVIGAVGFSQV
jgi:putative tricarboxylic transport membrane protein